MVMVHGTIRGSRLTIAFSSLAWMRNTVELQHERAARHHPRPSRKEVPDTPHTNTHHHMTPHHMTSQYTTHTTSHHIEPSDWQQAGSGYTHPHPHTHTLTHSHSLTHLPTMLSSTLDLPEDCEPTTTICGRSSACWPMALKTSCSLLMTGMRSVSLNSISELVSAKGE
jgi:hypothetical protein